MAACEKCDGAVFRPDFKFCLWCFLGRREEAERWVEEHKSEIYTRVDGQTRSLAELEAAGHPEASAWFMEFRRRYAAGITIFRLKSEAGA